MSILISHDLAMFTNVGYCVVGNKSETLYDKDKLFFAMHKITEKQYLTASIIDL